MLVVGLSVVMSAADTYNTIHIELLDENGEHAKIEGCEYADYVIYGYRRGVLSKIPISEDSVQYGFIKKRHYALYSHQGFSIYHIISGNVMHMYFNHIEGGKTFTFPNFKFRPGSYTLLKDSKDKEELRSFDYLPFSGDWGMLIHQRLDARYRILLIRDNSTYTRVHFTDTVPDGDTVKVIGHWRIYLSDPKFDLIDSFEITTGKNLQIYYQDDSIAYLNGKTRSCAYCGDNGVTPIHLTDTNLYDKLPLFFKHLCFQDVLNPRWKSESEKMLRVLEILPESMDMFDTESSKLYLKSMVIEDARHQGVAEAMRSRLIKCPGYHKELAETKRKFFDLEARALKYYAEEKYEKCLKYVDQAYAIYTMELEVDINPLWKLKAELPGKMARIRDSIAKREEILQTNKENHRLALKRSRQEQSLQKKQASKLAKTEKREKKEKKELQKRKRNLMYEKIGSLWKLKQSDSLVKTRKAVFYKRVFVYMDKGGSHSKTVKLKAKYKRKRGEKLLATDRRFNYVEKIFKNGKLVTRESKSYQYSPF